jgi:hypothetical protein
MTMHSSLLINPGPAETPGSNDRRVGAPNHHQHTGSGGTTMVGTIVAADHSPDEATSQFVRGQLIGQADRFVTDDAAGARVHIPDLVEVVIGIITEFTDHVVAERDALAEDLAFELNAHGAGQGGDR